MAAVGQVYLMDLLSSVFATKKLSLGQVLLTRQDLESGPRYFNARNTLETLLSIGAVPVINENDTVAVDELKFGDNDRPGRPGDQPGPGRPPGDPDRRARASSPPIPARTRTPSWVPLVKEITSKLESSAARRGGLRLPAPAAWSPSSWPPRMCA